MKKVVLIIIALVSLMFISEGIYQLRNNKDFRLRQYLYLSRFFANVSLARPAIYFLGKAAEVKIEAQAANFPEIIPPDYNLELKFGNKNTGWEDVVITFLRSSNYHSLANSNSEKLAKAFYFLGLNFYREGFLDAVIPLWQTSVYLAPFWSHFHVELANFYLQTGNKDSAEYQLEQCIAIPQPRNHCQMYLEDNLRLNKPSEVGFLEKFIEKEI